MREMRRRMFMVLLIACLLPLGGVAEGPSVGIEPPDTIRAFETCYIRLTLPAAGRLTVRVEGPGGEEREVVRELEASAGTLTIPYDATSYGGMPLRAGTYKMTAVLTGANGQSHTGTASVKAAFPASTVEYALPKSNALYQKRTSPWFVDCAVSGKCMVRFEVYADEAMTELKATVRKQLDNSGLFRIAWDGKKDGRRVEPGVYCCRVYAEGSEQRAVVFSLEVREGSEPSITLEPMGALLPEGTDDQAIWRAMMQPLVVVNIDAEKHQTLYAEPNPKSEVMGSVHGQSQGLEVVEVGKTYTLVRAWRHEDGERVEGYVPTKKLMVIQPNPHYGVLIDKKAQRLTVYEYGQPVGTASVSTGLQAPEKLFRETRSGAFMTTDRILPFDSKEYRYDYPIRIDGGNLIHQLGYIRSNDSMDFSRHEAQLGQKASEGCVRVNRRVDETNTINAYWLWTHLEYGTKVLVTED